MLFDAKFLTLLIFIIINLLILFIVKNRTTTITGLIIAHLIIVLFFSLSISNYNSFKEITLALIVYSTVILFLISNYNPVYLASDESLNSKVSKREMFFNISKKAAVFFLVVIVFFSLFFLAKNTQIIAENILDKKISRQEEVMRNPMIVVTHPVHVAIREFYLGKKPLDDWNDKISNQIEINERKMARLKDKLSDNFLLKRSSDVILIIVAITTSMLLFTSKKSEKKS